MSSQSKSDYERRAREHLAASKALNEEAGEMYEKRGECPAEFEARRRATVHLNQAFTLSVLSVGEQVKASTQMIRGVREDSYRDRQVLLQQVDHLRRILLQFISLNSEDITVRGISERMKARMKRMDEVFDE